MSRVESINSSVRIFPVQRIFPYRRKREVAECQEQHAAVQFCFLLRRTPEETVVVLKITCGDIVYDWFSLFKIGEMSMEDQPCSGCPSISKTEENVETINLFPPRGFEEVNVRKKKEDLWRTRDWVFHHNNSTDRTALSMKRFLIRNRMTPIVQPSHSPDLAPCDFFIPQT